MSRYISIYTLSNCTIIYIKLPIYTTLKNMTRSNMVCQLYRYLYTCSTKVQYLFYIHFSASPRRETISQTLQAVVPIYPWSPDRTVQEARLGTVANRLDSANRGRIKLLYYLLYPRHYCEAAWFSI